MHLKLALPLFLAVAEAWTPQSRAAAKANGEKITERWLPNDDKIRGVNLGSQFIIERWMAEESWKNMGCSAYNDEWACVKGIGQDKANAAFKKHWETWIIEDDIKQIASLGLNAVRIPVGYWMYEDIIQKGEYWPRGGIWHLDRIVGWCKKHGIYAVIGLHSAPGISSPNEQFTGHSIPNPGFYTAENYERAFKFLEWMTKRIHTNGNYTTVGMLEVLNEPVRAGKWKAEADDMIKNYYPGAYKRIQAMEGYLKVPKADRLHIQYMGKSWGAGDPRQYLPDDDLIFFDAHRYLSFDNRIAGNKKAYIQTACKDNMGQHVFVGEWSLSVNSTLKNTDEFKIEGQETWYKAYWAAQAESFEKSDGWFFWSWKCDGDLGKKDWRWCYQAAVAAGVIPKDAIESLFTYLLSYINAMADRYVTIHESPNGPGDSRPTAIQIIKDEGLEGKLSDQTVFITGCSAGIGIETAKALHLTGATLYLTARDLEKAKSALGDLAEDERVHLLELDLESLESVRSCAAKFLSESPKLNILICNAGVMCTPEGRTKEGFETQFGTNHLAHFLLLQLLQPALAKGATSDRASRVIMLSSLAHRFGEVDFDNVNMEGCYDPNKAYSQSKTANLWTANEIERRYASEGIHAWSVQPGGVLTDLGRHLSEEQKSGLAVDPYLKTIWKLPDQGAATSVWAAVAQALEGQGGKYLEDCQIVGKWDPSTPLYARGYGEHACDTEKAARLWNKSLEWIPFCRSILTSRVKESSHVYAEAIQSLIAVKLHLTIS
ncbi:glycoside hydrolase superfamily, partial [Fusarium oxysporum f. sp. albedinis]